MKLYEHYSYGERCETARGLTEDEVEAIVSKAEDEADGYGIWWWYEVEED